MATKTTQAPDSITVGLRLTGQLRTRYERYVKKMERALPDGAHVPTADVMRIIMEAGLDSLEAR